MSREFEQRNQKMENSEEITVESQVRLVMKITEEVDEAWKIAKEYTSERSIKIFNMKVAEFNEIVSRVMDYFDEREKQFEDEKLDPEVIQELEEREEAETQALQKFLKVDRFVVERL